MLPLTNIISIFHFAGSIVYLKGSINFCGEEKWGVARTKIMMSPLTRGCFHILVNILQDSTLHSLEPTLNRATRRLDILNRVTRRLDILNRATRQLGTRHLGTRHRATRQLVILVNLPRATQVWTLP